MITSSAIFALVLVVSMQLVVGTPVEPVITGPGWDATSVALYGQLITWTIKPQAPPAVAGANFVVDLSCVDDHDATNIIFTDTFTWTTTDTDPVATKSVSTTVGVGSTVTTFSCTFTNSGTDTANTAPSSSPYVTTLYSLPTATAVKTTLPLQGSTVVNFATTPPLVIDLHFTASCTNGVTVRYTSGSDFILLSGLGGAQGATVTFNAPSTLAAGTSSVCSFTRTTTDNTPPPADIALTIYQPQPIAAFISSTSLLYPSSGGTVALTTSPALGVEFDLFVTCTDSVGASLNVTYHDSPSTNTYLSLTTSTSSSNSYGTYFLITLPGSAAIGTATCTFTRHTATSPDTGSKLPADLQFTILQQPAPTVTANNLISPYGSVCVNFKPNAVIDITKPLLLEAVCSGVTTATTYALSYTSNTYVTLSGTDGTSTSSNNFCVTAQAKNEDISCGFSLAGSNTNNAVILPSSIVITVSGMYVTGAQVGTDATAVYTTIATTLTIKNYAKVTGGTLAIAVVCKDQSNTTQTIATSPFTWVVNTAAGTAKTFVLTPSGAATTITCTYTFSGSNADTANTRLPLSHSMMVTPQPTGPLVDLSSLPTTIYGGTVASGIKFQSGVGSFGGLILDITCFDGSGHTVSVSGSPLTLTNTSYAASFGFTISRYAYALGTGNCTFVRNSGSPDKITKVPVAFTFSIVCCQYAASAYLSVLDFPNGGPVYYGAPVEVVLYGPSGTGVSFRIDLICMGSSNGAILVTHTSVLDYSLPHPYDLIDFNANWVNETVTCVFTRNPLPTNNGIEAVPDNIQFMVVQQPAPTVAYSTVLSPNGSGCFTLSPTATVSSFRSVKLNLVCTGQTSSAAYVMTYSDAPNNFITLRSSDGKNVAASKVCVATQSMMETVNCVFSYDVNNTNPGVTLPNSVSFIVGFSITGAQIGTDTTVVYNNVATRFYVHTYATTVGTLVLGINCPGGTPNPSILTWTNGVWGGTSRDFSLTPSDTATTITCTYSLYSNNTDTVNTVLPSSHSMTITPQPVGPTVDPSSIPSIIYVGQNVYPITFLAPTPNLAHGNLVLDYPNCVDGQGHVMQLVVRTGLPITFDGSSSGPYSYGTDSLSLWGFEVPASGSAVGTAGQCSFARSTNRYFPSIDQITKVPTTIYFNITYYPAPVVSLVNGAVYYGTSNLIQVDGSGSAISKSLILSYTCTGSRSGAMVSNDWGIYLLPTYLYPEFTLNANWIGETVTCIFGRNSYWDNNQVIAVPMDFVFDVIQQPSPSVTLAFNTIAPYASNCLYFTPILRVSVDRVLRLNAICTGQASGAAYAMTYSANSYVTLQNSDGTSQSSNHVCVKAQGFIETVTCSFSSASTNTNNGVVLPSDVSFSVAGLLVTGAQLGSDTTLVYNNVGTTFTVNTYATVASSLILTVTCVDQTSASQTVDVSLLSWSAGDNTTITHEFILTPSSTATSITCTYGFDASNTDTANIVLPLSHTLTVTSDPAAPAIDSSSLPATINPGQSVTGIKFSAPTPNLAHGSLVLDITCVDGGGNSMTVTGNPITLFDTDFSASFGFDVPALVTALGTAGKCSFGRNSGSIDMITSLPADVTFHVTYLLAPVVTLVPAGPVYYGSNTSIQLTGTVISNFTVDILCTGSSSGVMLDSFVTLTSSIPTPWVILPAGRVTETVACVFTRDTISGNNGIVALPTDLTIHILPPPFSSSSSSSTGVGTSSSSSTSVSSSTAARSSSSSSTGTSTVHHISSSSSGTGSGLGSSATSGVIGSSSTGAATVRGTSSSSTGPCQLCAANTSPNVSFYLTLSLLMMVSFLISH